MEEVIYWLWLASLPNMNSHKITNLLTAFENAEQIYEAKAADYSGIYGLNAHDIAALSNKDLETAHTVLNRTELSGARVLTYDDINYPDMLRQIENPPYVLYIKGEIMKWDRLLPIAVVGTRNYTEYGLKAAVSICTDLARAGVTIVSGMARGLDSAAAVAAIRAGNKTIAVLGCGIDVVYPAENGKLMSAIEKHGAIITEYPPGTRPLGQNFPQRNRIISGLSRGTLVIQAPLKSGALITANYALESGKDVFAVPGDITSEYSRGTNALIKAGAKLVENAQDILDEYSFEINLLNLPAQKKEEVLEEIKYAKESKKSIKNKPCATEINNVKTVTIEDTRYKDLNEDERKIISMLIEKNMHIDDIAREGKLQANIVNATLTVLEMKGLVSQLPGKNFRLNI
ncbi:MAG: DNA-processing protein DprA [Clostridia bacterium]|nr:DNA-processing protein DprA [Clostridia bacterium]